MILVPVLCKALWGAILSNALEGGWQQLLSAFEHAELLLTFLSDIWGEFSPLPLSSSAVAAEVDWITERIYI